MEKKYAKEGEATRPFLATFQLAPTPTDSDDETPTVQTQTVNRFDELGTMTVTYEFYKQVMLSMGYEEVDFQYVR